MLPIKVESLTLISVIVLLSSFANTFLAMATEGGRGYQVQCICRTFKYSDLFNDLYR